METTFLAKSPITERCFPFPPFTEEGRIFTGGAVL